MIGIGFRDLLTDAHNWQMKQHGKLHLRLISMQSTVIKHVISGL